MSDQTGNTVMIPTDQVRPLIDEIERLRFSCSELSRDALDATFEIEHLRAENARLKAEALPNEQGKNRYGLDMAYFRNLINRELNHSRGLHDYKPDELARVFARMSKTADSSVLQEPEFQPDQQRGN